MRLALNQDLLGAKSGQLVNPLLDGQIEVAPSFGKFLANTVNQFLAKNFAVGFQGYYYSQVSNDSGSGAKLGSFNGESLGIGPALLWMPNFGKGKLSLIAKWLHDVDHKNRMEGGYGQFIVSYKF
jgi:hypothetical protein